MTMRTNCFLLLTVLLGILPMSNTHANDSIPKSVILYLSLIHIYLRHFYLIFIVLYLYLFQTGRKVSTFIRIKQGFLKIIHL